MRLVLTPPRFGLARGAWLSHQRGSCVPGFLGVLLVILLIPVVTGTLAYADGSVAAQTAPAEKLPGHEQHTPSARVADDAELSKLLAHTLPHFHIDPAALPAPVRQQVVERMREYGILYRAYLQGMLERAAPYLPMIRLTLQTNGVSEHFGYLSFIESAFHVDARHPKSGAAGLWQLMRNTARTYGLRVTKKIDERLEPTRATAAAIRYLRDLQSMFGSRYPLLMVAAYNYGEYNLSKAITRTRTRDIWRLVRLNQLPPQTREYLVRTIAIWVILAHVDRFGLRMDVPEQPLSYLELNFDDPVVLTKLAQQLKVSYQSLRAMNPHLLAKRVPSLVPIHVPADVLRSPMQVEVRIAPQALQDKTCCARLHLLAPSKAVERSTPPTVVMSRTASFKLTPVHEAPVLATVPK